MENQLHQWVTILSYILIVYYGDITVGIIFRLDKSLCHSYKQEAWVFTFEFKINEKTNRNVYNQQKVQPPRGGYESAPGYGNHTT